MAVEAALKNRLKRFVIDGEAVILGVDGISDFDALHSGKHSEKSSFVPSTSSLKVATICASCRCQCARPILPGLRGRPEGIFINPFEQGEIGPDLFRKACEFGLEGLVSKPLSIR